jgi:hypothetical protein
MIKDQSSDPRSLNQGTPELDPYVTLFNLGNPSAATDHLQAFLRHKHARTNQEQFLIPYKPYPAGAGSAFVIRCASACSVFKSSS